MVARSCVNRIRPFAAPSPADEQALTHTGKGTLAGLYSLTHCPCLVLVVLEVRLQLVPVSQVVRYHGVGVRQRHRGVSLCDCLWRAAILERPDKEFHENARGAYAQDA